MPLEAHDMPADNDTDPPFETAELRRNLRLFLKTPFDGVPVGRYTWGVYAFYDYDGEPIYVGQTNEKVSGRISRHLTNQRTDAVAMSVLDPFEVFEVAIWPLPEFQEVRGKHHPEFKAARTRLDALEHQIYTEAIRQSEFKAILNEKAPPKPVNAVEMPRCCRGRIVSPQLLESRGHPDFRIARRAQTLSRLAQVISERQVQGGLRQALLTQSKRLAWLAERRLRAVGDDGEADSDVR